MKDNATKEKHCPACGSQTLARVRRTFWQRLSGLSGQTRRYRCLFCGHDFLERARDTEEPPPEES